MVLTLKGSDDENGCTLSGFDIRSHLTVGFAQSRSPTATKFGPSRTINLPKKENLSVCGADFDQRSQISDGVRNKTVLIWDLESEI
jgi:hypothetical protein